MGRHQGKRQVVVYLPESTYKRLKVRAARAGVSMSQFVEQALAADHGAHGRPVRPLSLAPEPPLPRGAAALVAHGAPLLGRPDTELSLEDAIVLGIKEARLSPALLRALVVVLVRNEVIDWRAVLERLAPEERPALGAVVDVAAEAAGDERLRRKADELFARVGPAQPEQPFFTKPSLARHARALAERTPREMRRWGFVCATPLDDFREAVRRLAGVPAR